MSDDAARNDRAYLALDWLVRRHAASWVGYSDLAQGWAPLAGVAPIVNLETAEAARPAVLKAHWAMERHIERRGLSATGPAAMGMTYQIATRNAILAMRRSGRREMVWWAAWGSRWEANDPGGAWRAESRQATAWQELDATLCKVADVLIAAKSLAWASCWDLAWRTTVMDQSSLDSFAAGPDSAATTLDPIAELLRQDAVCRIESKEATKMFDTAPPWREERHGPDIFRVHRDGRVVAYTRETVPTRHGRWSATAWTAHPLHHDDAEWAALVADATRDELHAALAEWEAEAPPPAEDVCGYSYDHTDPHDDGVCRECGADLTLEDE